MKSKHDYIKNMFEDREQTRWNTADIDDAATLLMELMELEWRYHHLALLYYRNRHHKDFHTYWGMYWATKSVINVMFPWFNSHDAFSGIVSELNRLIDEQDTEMLTRSGC